ncbi:MAG TPA: serine/threonine-protein kinase, partial [Vicinamibacteria bacterium]|nr:serine/threonine-protein kinase [Vicinamibacteria bacterium]
MTFASGSTFGPYQILDPLGRGGMATVYKAYEPGLDRYVALKILPSEFLHDEGFAERFRREAKVIARLEHPNIIPIHNFGIEEQSHTPWMAMRLIGGGALSGYMKKARLGPERTVTILRGVAEALDYAHGKGVIHRDIKPQNILVDEADRVYLADFGIAKMVEGSSGLTATGMISGTPQYMAPEQAMAGVVDNRADIYALGIVAYEMLTGRVPFAADTPVAVLMKHVQD